ncbi:MAG: bifunctional UDP-2,4-diacetamido-2,4,6-trideoxy-beta-L-altropyranose hydrolase/GNAT family N-acetyltransferase, partial [Pseudomonadota bacterium]
CLGLPTVVLTLADNQREIVSVLEDENSAVACEIKAEEISSSIERLLRDDDFRKSISKRSSELCDGGGSKRVVRELLASSIMLRKARSDDAVFVYKARYDDDAHRYYRSQNKPDLDGHVSWFETALSDSRRQLLIARISETDVGHVRFDFEKGNDQVAEIGIAISSAHRGKGLAVPILVQSTRHFASNGGKTIKAEVYRDNPASQRAFEAAGFMFQTEDEDGFRQFEWNSDQLM